MSAKLEAWVSAAALAAGLMAAPGQAAVSTGDDAASVAEGEAIDPDEIVVTAQRRAENLRDVPVAVTAIGSDYLQKRGIDSIDNIGSAAPNVKIQAAPSSKTTSQISIRGSASSNPAITTEPTVGLYLDGIYIAKAAGSIFDIVDLERVEVLRGPQGTLYGRNTLAGAINLVPKKPSGEFGGRVEATYGSYDERKLKAVIDLPAVGPFSAKVSGQLRKRDGLIDLVPNPYPQAVLARPNPAKDTDDIDQLTFAGQLRFAPSDNLTVDYMYDHSRTRQTPYFAQLYRVNLGRPGDIFDPASPSYPFFGANFPLSLYTRTERQKTASIDVDVREHVKVRGHSFIASLDIGAATLKSLTSYRKIDYRDALDLDGTPIPVASTQRITDYHAFSQEVQLTGEAFNDVVKYVFGAYYFKDHAETNNPQSYFAGASRFDSRYGQHTQSYAAYGQIDVSVTPRLTLSGGLRYTHEKKDIKRFLATSAGGPFATQIDVPYGGVPDADFERLSPAASVRYEFSDQVTAYARYAQGYKSGGFNAETAVTAAPTPACPSGVPELCAPYRPEVVDSYEVGIKTSLLDRRLQLNLTGFWDEHKDLQLSVFLGNQSAASVIRNAAATRTRGIEIEALARPADWFTLNASVGLLDAKYKSFIDGGVEVADNRAFPSAPSYTIQTGFDWRVVEGNWGQFSVIGDLSFTSSFYTSPYQLRGPAVPGPTSPQLARLTKSPGRAIVNLRGILAEVPIGSMRGELTLWARNLFKEDAPQNFIDFGPSFGGLTVAYYPEPRTFGATLGLRF
ncbi:MAG: TonB-dependent receptor [Sphingopyxis sp.]|uniref:TonB-dependent receptor n=1 Tax=Sphingopyxis sp. TaxID=1908224 RepID=UPI0032EC9DA7